MTKWHTRVKSKTFRDNICNECGAIVPMLQQREVCRCTDCTMKYHVRLRKLTDEDDEYGNNL